MYPVDDGTQSFFLTSVSHTALGTKLVPRNHNHLTRSYPGVRLSIWRVRLLCSSITRGIFSMEKKKAACLASLVLQTTCLVLTIRYSRIAHVSGPRYLTSTAVVLSEVIKMLICICMTFITGDRSLPTSSLGEQVRETVRLSVPSGLYTLQNNLQFVAVSNLDAATFQVTYQLKILTTAMFSVMFLKRNLGNFKWASLVLLTVGVALVQIPVTRGCYGDECDVATDNSRASWLAGLSAVIVMCLSSGFAGVYFEKVLKSTQQSVWVRNVQMALSGIVFAILCSAFTDGEHILEGGFFQGYNVIIWTIILQQAALGLVVSLVVKYADNILKGFANAVSILLSTLISYMILSDLNISFMFVLGAVTVVAATFLYSCDPNRLLVKRSASETV